MGAEIAGEDAMAGKRSVKRARVLLAARLKTSAGEIDARLRDLSQKGALIECDAELSVGDEVVFIRGSIAVPARVAWTARNRSGLEFLHMIDESEVLVHVARPQARQPERFRRPRIAREDLTDEERKLSRIWAASVGVSIRKD